MQPRASLSVVFGGGGPFGIAYGLGVAHTLQQAGVSLEDAPTLGTSAGAWVGAAVRCGTPVEQLLALDFRVPDMHPHGLQRLTHEVFGSRHCPGLRAGAVRLPTLRHELLDAGQLPVDQVAAASAAVPGLFAPVHVAEHVYVDGGLRSNTSADLAAPADVLLVVAPLTGPSVPPAGWWWAWQVRAEMRRWALAHGGQTVLLRPDGEVARTTRDPLHLFSRGCLADVYTAAREQTREWLATDAAGPLRRATAV